MTSEEYLDALLSLPGLSRPQVSRDRRWVAWSWFRAGPAADVYVAPTDGSTAPRRLSDNLENTYLIGWVPDSSAVLVAQDQSGNERDQLSRINIERPLELQPLTEAEPDYFIRGGDLHPNGRWLVYGANLDPATGEEIEPTWIFRHDVRSGDRVVLASHGRVAISGQS